MSFRRSGVLLATVVSTVSLAAAGNPPKDLAVTSLVADYAADIAPALQIQSDQRGTYTNSSTISSVIQPGGNWVLDTRASTRTAYLGFTQPVAGTGPTGSPSFPSGFYAVRILTECQSSISRFNLLTLPGGASTECPLHIGFVSEGASYAIEMNPIDAINGPFPQTNLATVTCIAPTAGLVPCTQWKVTPSQAVTQTNGSVVYQNEGALLSYSTVKGKTVATYLGDFLFSFEFVVTNP